MTTAEKIIKKELQELEDNTKKIEELAKKIKQDATCTIHGREGCEQEFPYV